MSTELEKQDRFERELPGLFKVAMPEDFWARQKNSVLARIEAPRRWSRALTWAVVPFFAGALGVLVIFRFVSGPPEPVSSPQSVVENVPPPQDWALLEKLDLIESFDKVKSIGSERS